MKRTILSLLIAGIFAGAGTLAVAQNVTSEEQAGTSQTQPSTDTDNVSGQAVDDGSTSTGSQAQSDDDSTGSQAQSDQGSNTGDQAKSGEAYNQAATKAQAEFTEANAKCDDLQGAEKTTCVSDAETARTEALAEAEKEWNSQNDQQSMNEGEDQIGDQAANEEGMTAPVDDAAATATDGQQTGQAGSQDGMTEPDDSAAAGTDDEQTDQTGQAGSQDGMTEPDDSAAAGTGEEQADQTGEAGSQDGMTEPDDSAAAGTGEEQADQTGQAESQDGTSGDRAAANPEEQDPERTAAATDSGAPNSAELGEVNQE